MKILNIEDFVVSDYREVSSITDQLLRDWGSEKVYFNSLTHCPDFGEEKYKKLIDDTQKANDEIATLKRSFLSPANQAKVNASHPSKKSEEEKAKLLIEKTSEFIDAYKALDEYRIKYSTLGRLEEQFFKKITELEESVFSDTQKQIDALTTTVLDEIKKGIKSVVDLKSELGLTEKFGEKIESELVAAKQKESRFMVAFIIALVLIPVSVFAVNIFTESMVDAVSGYILKGSIAVSLLFISLFFFSQYRTYMMIRLRYTHLDGFLGGGATFISQLLEADNPDLKLEVNKKLAEMFMSLDDVLKMVQKSKHPTELTLETAENVYDKLNKIKKS